MKQNNVPVSKKLLTLLSNVNKTEADEHDTMVMCNGVDGLTRDDLAHLIGLAQKDTDLCYRLAKMLVNQNRL
jgi:hypothetical protein